MLIDVPDEPREGDSVSVIVFPWLDRRDLNGAWADERYRHTGYESPLVLFGEVLNAGDASQLRSALNIIRTLHGLPSREALGFLVNLFVVIMDIALARRGGESILYRGGRSWAPAERGGPSPDLHPTSDRPTSSIASFLLMWHQFSRFGVTSLFRSPDNSTGRVGYLTIPPNWIPTERLRELGKPAAGARTIPVIVDCEFAPVVARHAEYLAALRPLVGTVSVSFGGSPSPVQSHVDPPRAVL